MQLPPVVGGVGLLPLVQRVQARQVGLTARCVLGACGLLPYVPPWTRVAVAWLRRMHSDVTPLRLLMHGGGSRVLGKPLAPACPPSARLLGAMSHLPPLSLVAPPAPGAWVAHVPLWAHPALCVGAGGTWDVAFADLYNLPGLLRVGQLVDAHDGLDEYREASQHPGRWGPRYAEAFDGVYLLPYCVAAGAPVSAAVSAVAPPWPCLSPRSSGQVCGGSHPSAAWLGGSRACRAAGDGAGCRSAAGHCGAGSCYCGGVTDVVRELGWVPAAGQPLMITEYTVMAPQLAALQALHTRV